MSRETEHFSTVVSEADTRPKSANVGKTLIFFKKMTRKFVKRSTFFFYLLIVHHISKADHTYNHNPDPNPFYH